MNRRRFLQFLPAIPVIGSLLLKEQKEKPEKKPKKKVKIATMGGWASTVPLTSEDPEMFIR